MVRVCANSVERKREKRRERERECVVLCVCVFNYNGHTDHRLLRRLLRIRT